MHINFEVSQESKIQSLVQKKHPLFKALRLSPETRGKVKNSQDILKNGRIYKEELESKPLHEVNKLYDDMLEEERKISQKKAEEEEKKRFYNQSYTDANFEHWGKRSSWTMDESIALSFGKDPNQVNWNAITKYSSSPFIQKYTELRDLVINAKRCDDLYDLMLPGIFIGWAKDRDIPFPEELEELVVKYGGSIIQWRVKYSSLEKLNKENIEKAQEQFGKYEACIRQLEEEITTLKEKLEQKSEPLGIKEQRTQELSSVINRVIELDPSIDISSLPQTKEAFMQYIILQNCPSFVKARHVSNIDTHKGDINIGFEVKRGSKYENFWQNFAEKYGDKLYI